MQTIAACLTMNSAIAVPPALVDAYSRRNDESLQAQAVEAGAVEIATI
ncbi:hypothetical protein AB4Y40_28080 [Paraburkholderia sp. EG287B]